MRHLVLANTPAHAHLYRNVVPALTERGHDVLVLGRDYGCTRALLEYFDLPHVIYGGQESRFSSLVANVPSQFYRVARLAREFDPDLVFGRGAYAVVAGETTRTPVTLVLDSEPSHLAHRVCSHFAGAVLTPAAFRDDLGDRHYRFDGVTETAYLHPSVFEPDPSVREELGLEPDERVVVLRFNAWDALHDVGAHGFSAAERAELVETLAEHATVLVSDEGGTFPFESLPARPYDVHPGRIHDVLAAADLLVADTGTMVTEAALVGTPAIRVVDPDETPMGEFAELERNGLVHQHSRFSAVVEDAVALLSDPTAGARWERRRRAYLDASANLTDLLVAVAEAPERTGELVAASRTGDEGTLTDTVVSNEKRRGQHPQ